MNWTQRKEGEEAYEEMDDDENLKIEEMEKFQTLYSYFHVLSSMLQCTSLLWYRTIL